MKETGRLIGDAGVSRVEGRPLEIEIGYCIGREYRRRGYAAELLGAVSVYAASRFGARTICGRVLRGNEASVKVPEKNTYRFIAEEYGAEDDPYGRGMLVFGKEFNT